MVLQDGWFQCPMCDGIMLLFEKESYGMCGVCATQHEVFIKDFEEQLEIERMEDEGGPVSG